MRYRIRPIREGLFVVEENCGVSWFPLWFKRKDYRNGGQDHFTKEQAFNLVDWLKQLDFEHSLREKKNKKFVRDNPTIYIP